MGTQYVKFISFSLLYSQTESDAYEPTVQICTGGLKKGLAMYFTWPLPVMLLRVQECIYHKFRNEYLYVVNFVHFMQLEKNYIINRA